VAGLFPTAEVLYHPAAAGTSPAITEYENIVENKKGGHID
jgi:hypothetical protein